MSGATFKIEAKPFNEVCPLRKKKFKFALFSSGQICGNRLYHDEDVKDAKQRWPFAKTNDSWMYYDNKKEAEQAAAKLQAYLDARERGKGKKK